MSRLPNSSNLRLPFAALPFAILCLTAFAACSNETSDPGDGMPPVGASELTLRALTDVELNLMEGATAPIRVGLYDADGAAVSAQNIAFEVIGESAGATLSPVTGESDENGEFATVLSSVGAATFVVKASSNLATNAVDFQINVDRIDFGALNYVVRDPLDLGVTSADAGLLVGVDCASLTDAAAVREAAGVEIDAASTFESVPRGMPLAIIAFGNSAEDHALAFGCANTTLTDLIGSIDVTLDPIDDRLGGTYAIDERVNVFKNAGPLVNGVLDFIAVPDADADRFAEKLLLASAGTVGLASGLARDADGDDIPDDLDGDGLPDRLSATGVLARIVLANFLEANVNLPDWSTRIASGSEDARDALRRMTFQGELTVEDGVTDSLDASHTIERIQYDLDAGPVTRAVTPVSATTALARTSGAPVGGVSGIETVIESRDFDAFPFGAVVEVVIEDAVLANVPGMPSTVGELFVQMIDCVSVIDAIDRDGVRSVGESILADLCPVIVQAAGDFAQGRLTRLFNWDKLTLAEEALIMTSQDGDLAADTGTGITLGRWENPTKMTGFDLTDGACSLERTDADVALIGLNAVLRERVREAIPAP